MKVNTEITSWNGPATINIGNADHLWLKALEPATVDLELGLIGALFLCWAADYDVMISYNGPENKCTVSLDTKGGRFRQR